jgi:hypothetical protein
MEMMMMILDWVRVGDLCHICLLSLRWAQWTVRINLGVQGEKMMINRH